MDARLLTKIGLRILAVFLVGLGFWVVPSYFMFAYGNIPPNSMTGDTASYLQLFFNPAMYGVILWFLAPYLAKLAAGKEAAETPAPANPAAWQTAALTVVGAFFIVQNVPVFLGLMVEFLGKGPDGRSWVDSDWAGLVDHLTVAAARVLLGVVLVLGTGYFTRLFRRFREFGLPPASGG